MIQRGYRGKNKSERGSTITEFAIIAPTLMMLLVASFSLGMGLQRMILAGQVCRNANVLTVRGIDLSQTSNQSLLVRTAAGLGLNQSGTNTPDPNGKAVVYMTKVIKVGPNECTLGITNWDGTQGSCPNYGQYVIASRIAIGNTTKWSSVIGNPSSTPASNGSLTDNQIATITTNRAHSFADTGSTIITLSLDEYTFVSEVFADSSDLVIPYLFTTNQISVRNVS